MKEKSLKIKQCRFQNIKVEVWAWWVTQWRGTCLPRRGIMVTQVRHMKAQHHEGIAAGDGIFQNGKKFIVKLWTEVTICPWPHDSYSPRLSSVYAGSWLIGKDPDARKNWGQEETGMTEDEVVRWHHWLSGHDFEETQGVSNRQGNLACYAVHGVTKSWTWLGHWTAACWCCREQTDRRRS